MVESGVKHHKLSEIYQFFLKHINSRDKFISKLDKKYKYFQSYKYSKSPNVGSLMHFFTGGLRKRFFRNQQINKSQTRIAYGGHVC
jgi:hypothetical protein